MKSQLHNQGDLKPLSVQIEKKVVEDIERMAQVSGMTVSEIVVIALKRFRASHSDYSGTSLKTE